jgi:GntR family transcriptional regulator, transcriptional repressor for pyruvate dehydrogenase complex
VPLVKPVAKLVRPVASGTALRDGRTASGAVFSRLRNEILSGAVSPGERIASERSLAEELRVSRHAVREAVKRLQQAGLVAVAQGGATRVLDLERNGGLDLLPHLSNRGSDRIDPKVVRAALEMRASIGADAARLCARRASAEIRVALAAKVAEMRRSDDLSALTDLDTEFWGLVVDGADNVAYRLAFNSLIRCLRANRKGALALISEELLDWRRRALVEDAIAEGNEKAAERHARKALGGSLEAFDELVPNLERGGRG